jgi:hypothetical protein
MKFVKKPGSAGLFLFCRRIAPQVASYEFLRVRVFTGPKWESALKQFTMAATKIDVGC